MQVFISYARVDSDTAALVVSDLSDLGHRAFYDRELVGGQRWWDELLDQIEQSQVFMPLLSEAYRDSEACRAEALWAERLGLPFIPLTNDDQIPGLYDPVIAEANWVQYDDSRDAIKRLARALSAVPLADPPGPHPERPPIPMTFLHALAAQIRGPEEIGRRDQLALLSDLRSKLGTRDDVTVRSLLVSLRARAEITYEAATTIEGLLGQPAAEIADTASPVPSAPRVSPRPTKVPPSEPPKSDSAASTQPRAHAPEPLGSAQQHVVVAPRDRPPVAGSAPPGWWWPFALMGAVVVIAVVVGLIANA